MLSFAQYVHGIIVTEVASEGGVLGPLRLRLAGLLPLTTSMARFQLFSQRQEVAREQSFPSSPHRVPFDVLAGDLGSRRHFANYQKRWNMPVRINQHSF